MFSDKKTFKKRYLERLELMHGKPLDEITDTEKFLTLGTMIREYITRDWILTNKSYKSAGVKQVYYFSMEFLLGRLVGNNLLNLGIKEIVEEGLEELGIDFTELKLQEPDAGLGNGGLGRLAACFLDSMASLGLAGHGCGIRYKYGLFEQKVINGHQVELPEQWLRDGNVWEIRKSDKSVEVRFGGQVRVEKSGDRLVFHHEGYDAVLAVPYDVPVIGYGNNKVNTLRLWNAEFAAQKPDFFTPAYANQQKILEYKQSVEAISQFLYPDDTHDAGRLLRLKQEYFLVSAGLQSIIRRHKKNNHDIRELDKNVAIHINDTHPALAIPELMRILMDVEGLGWQEAYNITIKTMSFTNHTTLSEALETWPVDMFKLLLPRIYMIVEELNERFCRQLWDMYSGDWDRIGSMAIIADGIVKMANLAIAGSHSVNGVAKVHTEILKNRVMNNFYTAFPHRFNNKTNGVTHRRWLLKANKALSKLITEVIGPDWINCPSKLNGLLDYANDSNFLNEISKIKHQNKLKLARIIKNSCNLDVDVNSIFDVHIKRIHAYKRQLLNILHVLYLYNRLLENSDYDILPRTFIFGGKAAPGYYLAKKIIKLINSVASVINNDKTINNKIKVVFLENYRVSLAEEIIPATDVSEQISTAGKEASGTGNMKFMMNGALTIGTMDGANIEIMEEVGKENIFIFGLTQEEVFDYYYHGNYRSYDIYHKDIRIKTVLDLLINGFIPGGWEEFGTIFESLLTHNDEYFVLKDFNSYTAAQQRVDKTYRDRDKWLKMCAINIARSGKFSSDRTISEYASEIWRIKPYQI